MLYTIEVDSNFQKVFSVQLTDGNWRQLFRQKNAVVLSRSAARRIFGKQNPVGKVFHPNKLTRRSERNYTPEELTAIDYVVSGVMEDLPVNASYSLLNRIDALLINDQQGRFAGYVPGEGTGCTTFALLYPGVKKETVNQRIDPEKIRFLSREWKEDRSYCHPERTVRNIIMISAMGIYASDY